MAGTPFCRGCGAVFVKDGKGGPVTPGDPAKPGPAAEIALKRELDFYRLKAGKLLIGGLVLFATGALLALFYSPSGGAPRQGLWVGRGTGILMALFGAWMLYVASRRLTVGVRGREASYRRVLGIEGGISPPQPSRVGRLVALLVAILVVAALYWLSQKYQAM